MIPAGLSRPGPPPCLLKILSESSLSIANHVSTSCDFVSPPIWEEPVVFGVIERFHCYFEYTHTRHLKVSNPYPTSGFTTYDPRDETSLCQHVSSYENNNWNLREQSLFLL